MSLGKAPITGEQRSPDIDKRRSSPARMRKMLSIRAALAMLVVSAVASLPAAEVTTPAMADRFADSVGINVHLHHTGTPYDNFELVRTRLVDLGVRHLRDGLIDTTW